MYVCHICMYVMYVCMYTYVIMYIISLTFVLVQSFATDDCTGPSFIYYGLLDTCFYGFDSYLFITVVGKFLNHFIYFISNSFIIFITINNIFIIL